MDDQHNPNEVTLPPTPAVRIEARELIRDWKFFFWSFLPLGLGRLVRLHAHRPEHTVFDLGRTCGFVFAGALGCVYVGLGPGLSPDTSDRGNLQIMMHGSYPRR